MISWAAIDRIIERRRASDPKYRRQTVGRPVRSDANRYTDEELLAKLRSFGIDLDRQFPAARITVCEEGLRRFAADDALLTENRRRALAESYVELGETGQAEGLYRERLQAGPAWGWGWIGWSDGYRFGRPEGRDLQRAEELLRAGLAIPDVRDRRDPAERLADLYDQQGRGEEAQAVRRQASGSLPAITQTREVRLSGRVRREKATITFGGEGLPLRELPKVAARLRSSPSPGPLSRQKVGRNDPWQCGSGKKFKKCCGGVDRTREPAE